MKEPVLQSLVPLLLLVHDERPNVSQVCWDTLSSAAEFLKWHQLGGFIQRKDTWQSCDCLLTRYKGRANNFLCQTMAFLENPQTPLRQAAIRFIGNHRAGVPLTGGLDPVPGSPQSLPAAISNPWSPSPPPPYPTMGSW
ncbi:maestro heat-like repeat-containing protein family member 6 [Chrysemys picta bellii]|uniref:maestro heat-like repeat-containing protein family member 6 n=1 Tax=Chrysemys picta bellii TaxID=8478 RepID=UPI0032B157A3